MKKTKLTRFTLPFLILTGLLFGFTEHSTAQTSRNDQTKFVTVRGKRIISPDGKELHLKGIGLGGWMLQEPYMLKLSGVAVNQTDIKAKITALIGERRTREFYDEWLKDGMQKSDVDSLAAWGFNPDYS